jgi:hypothetical protein
VIQGFSDIVDVSGHETTVLKTVQDETFREYFEQRKHRHIKPVSAQESYFEGDRNSY